MRLLRSKISAHISQQLKSQLKSSGMPRRSTPTSIGFGLSDSEIGILKSTYARSNIRHDAEAEPPTCQNAPWSPTGNLTVIDGPVEETWEFEISWRRGLGAGRPGGVWSLFRLHSAILGRLVPQ